MADIVDPEGIEEEEEESTPSSPPSLFIDTNKDLGFTNWSNASPSQQLEGSKAGTQSVIDPRNIAAPYDQRARTNPYLLDDHEQEDPNYAVDAVKGVVYGGLGFAESLIDLAGDAGNSAIWIAERAGLNAEGGFRFGEVDLNDDFKPETWLGTAIGGITQVAAGWALTAATLGIAAPASIAATASVGLKGAAGMSRYGQFLKWAAFTEGTKAGRMRRGLTVGAIADFIAFKEHEERLSNLIKDTPLLGNTVTKWLAADKDDNWLEGRIKNALEGGGIGLIFEFVLKGALKTQKAVSDNIAKGRFDKAMQLQREAGPEFLEKLKEIRDGEEVIVLHNESVFRQYLTLLPDMDPAKMQAAVALMRTAARMHQFRDLNSYLQQGMRTATLNKSFPGGALEDLNPSVFSDPKAIQAGMEGPMGDGTPYALFEGKSWRGIRNRLNAMKTRGQISGWTTHQRVSKNKGRSSKETIYIVPGMTLEQTAQLARASGKNSFVTHKGIHKVTDTDSREWKVNSLKSIEASDTGAYSFKDSKGNKVSYDLNYSEIEQSYIPSKHGDETVYAKQDPEDYPQTQAGSFPDRVDTDKSAKYLKRPPRPGGDLPKGTLERDFANLNGVLKIFKNVSMYDVDDAMNLLDTRPEYLHDVSKFINRQRSKAQNGKMTVRDVMKAALMTVGSQQSSAKSWAQRGAKAGIKKPEGIKSRMLDSMKFGIRRIKRDKKGKPIGRMRREADSKVSVRKMRDQYNKFKHISDRSDVSDKFITFVDWVEKPPSKGASWRQGDEVGGTRAFEKSKHRGKGDVDDMVRPEEYVALWIMSPNGRLALDALEKGEILTELWEELRHLRAALGSDALSNTNLLPRLLRKTRAGKGSAKQLAGATTKKNIAELANITLRFNRHLTGKDPDGLKIKDWKKEDGWNTEYIGNLFKEVAGVSDAKEGFMKHYLGIGDTATVDSAQLRFWLTGLKKGEMGAKGSIEEMHRLLYSKANKLMKGKNRDLFIARVRKQQEELLTKMRKDLDKNGRATNADLDAHVLHHWLWDKVMQVESMTPSARTAMTFAQTGPHGNIRGGVTFASDGEAILNLFTKSFSDKYGRNYIASDFSTLVHEIGHIYRRAMKDPIALRRKMEGQTVEGFKAGPSHAHTMTKIEKALGVENGKWTRKHEEKFAEMFESWVGGGTKFPEGLEKEFGEMKGWMQELYRNVHNSSMKHRLTPEIQGFFSRIFGREGLPTFLTPEDHHQLAQRFVERIDEGGALDDALEEVGLNLRLWDDESEIEDVMGGLVKWLNEHKVKIGVDEQGREIKGTILERYKNYEKKPGGGGLAPRAGDEKKINTQFNDTTEALARDMADSFGADPDALLQALRQDIAPEDLPVHLVAGKILMHGYSRSIFHLANKVTTGEGGERAAATLKILQERFVDVYSSVMRIQRGAARTTQAGNIAIKGMDPDDMYQIIMNSGGINKIKKFAEDIVTGADRQRGLANLKQLRHQSKNQLFWDLTHEYRVNGLLSSLKSLTVDLTSTTLHTALLPTERIAGGYLMGDRELVRQGTSLYVGYALALRESIQLAWKAMVQEKQIIDPLVRSSETVQNAWSKDRIQQVFPDARGWSPQGILAGFFHYAGFYVRWPSRLRMGSKELFDQISYRARLRDILIQEGMNKFPAINPKKVKDAAHMKLLRKQRSDNIAKYVVENFEAGFDAMGRGVNKDAMQYAREVNFSEPLTEGLGAVVQSWKHKSPPAGLLVPFVRTPTWLIRGFIGRSFGTLAMIPGLGSMVATLNPALKAIREDFLAGGARRAKALGKVNTAYVLFGTAVVLANDGAPLPGGKRARIIGTGPPDPAQRKIWEASGKTANSVEITDAEGNKTYIGFDRLDPFWMWAGFGGDYVQLGSYLTNDQMEDLAAFGVLAFVNRLDGAYMKSALDAAGAWSAGGGKLSSFLSNMVKSGVRRADILPIAQDSIISGIPGLEGLDDPYRRENETILSAWQTVFPFLWDKYGVKYDTITGEPIKKQQAWGEGLPFGMGHVAGEVSPFLYSESPAKNNPLGEISETLYGFQGPSFKKSIGGADLDLRDLNTDYEDDDGIRVRNVYQAWNKEIGKTQIKESLNRLTSSPVWDKLPRDEKISNIKQTIRDFREMAWGQLLVKNPKIREQVKQARINRLNQLREARMSERLSNQ